MYFLIICMFILNSLRSEITHAKGSLPPERVQADVTRYIFVNHCFVLLKKQS